MKEAEKIIDRIAYVVWTIFSCLFMALGIWLFFYLLLTGEYIPGPEVKTDIGLKLWRVAWDILRALIIGPAPAVLLGFLFRRFALLSKPSRIDPIDTRISAGK